MSLDRPSFPTVRLTEGYDIEEVDRAVERVRVGLASPSPTIGRSEIEGLRFTPVRLRPGYEMAAVDDWLDEVVAELARRRGEPAVAPQQRLTPMPAAAAEPSVAEPSARSQTTGDLLQAALIIAVVVGAAVWLYVPGSDPAAGAPIVRVRGRSSTTSAAVTP
ncbi:DivIVA domain-containing protein [Nocardioides alpinus]|uniref:DivIVA domain-containing protein n=1 Tax=Nocardioides alpinus TaxID=748909 RepID=A0A1I0VZL4_9ACTN|nr:DivIVA domain-containing protein [Nocardioides alpinus]